MGRRAVRPQSVPSRRARTRRCRRVDPHVAVRHVRGHAPWRQADAREHLEAEVRSRARGCRARGNGDWPSIIASGYAPSGFDAADEPRFGAHREEPRRLRVDVERQLRTERSDARKHAQAFDELQLGLGIGFDRRGHVVEHLPNELPRLEREASALGRRHRSSVNRCGPAPARPSCTRPAAPNRSRPWPVAAPRPPRRAPGGRSRCT